MQTEKHKHERHPSLVPPKKTDLGPSTYLYESQEFFSAPAIKGEFQDNPYPPYAWAASLASCLSDVRACGNFCLMCLAYLFGMCLYCRQNGDFKFLYMYLFVNSKVISIYFYSMCENINSRLYCVIMIYHNVNQTHPGNAYPRQGG